MAVQHGNGAQRTDQKVGRDHCIHAPENLNVFSKVGSDARVVLPFGATRTEASIAL